MAEKGSPLFTGSSGVDVIGQLKFKKLADMVVDKAFSQGDAHQNQTDDQKRASEFWHEFRGIQGVLAGKHPAQGQEVARKARVDGKK